MLSPAKHDVLGVRISKTSYAEVVGLCRRWIEDRHAGAAAGRFICVTSVHGIVTALRQPALKEILNRADVATPDGMPVVWALRSFGAKGQQRVYGPDLMLALCQQAAQSGHRIFLYGSREETLGKLRTRLADLYPGIRIAGSWAPPFRELSAEEDANCARMIHESGADLVFVGISTPKQELWMARQVERLPGVVLVGVGAAFDFHAGVVRQAPRWMQRHGLEWLFRLYMEPARLWRRYLLETPVFLPLWAMQKIGLYRG